MSGVKLRKPRTRLPRPDWIDLKILKILQEHGRIGNAALAKMVGISAAPCLRRVRALEQQGMVQGYFAQINHVSLGQGVSALVLLQLTCTLALRPTLLEKILGIPAVRECYAASADAVYWLRIAGTSITSLTDLINLELQPLPHIKIQQIFFSEHRIKWLPGAAIADTMINRAKQTH